MDDFQVFVKPVGASCNLACSYCYYLAKSELSADSGLHRMADDLLEMYIVQHVEASTEPTIFFSWHGGEPTLAGLDYFRRITEIQKKHLPPDRFALNGIQTNGTLLNNEWCQFLKKENFIVGISLDGPERFHSVNRFRKDGKSSFDEVLRGFRLLQSYQIPCEILCVVHAQNVEFPLEVYRFFKNLKAEFITFLPLVEKQTSGEKAVSEKTVSAKAFGEFLCAIFDEWKTSDIGTVKIQIFEEALRTAFGVDHSLCIFKPACGRVPVIEHNGDFYSCDHFVGPAYRIGNVRHSTLSEMLESPAQKAFGLAKLNTLPEYCLNCEVLNFCNGACPKDRFIETPEGEPALNYLCEGYKLFFNHCKPFVKEVAEVWSSENASPQPLP
ncbi:MAG: anaerobic sulfatase maturase [Bacteroidetes bacterium GWB2_41_8]|nr:MAG: anaerobic sulfatase maturase [Bacteroidetes bacterium GWB2_41_8]